MSYSLEDLSNIVCQYTAEFVGKDEVLPAEKLSELGLVGDRLVGLFEYFSKKYRRPYIAAEADPRLSKFFKANPLTVADIIKYTSCIIEANCANENVIKPVI